jgi:hypothetical protein
LIIILYFKTNKDIQKMINIHNANEIRCFDVIWKQSEHGKQELDLSDSNIVKLLLDTNDMLVLIMMLVVL